MITKKLVLVMLLFAFVATEEAFNQENLKAVGGYEYAQFDGVWYSVINRERGDRVDTLHLTVRLKSRGNIDQFNFASIGVPPLKNTRGRIADGFYELEVPGGSDPFEVMAKMQSSGLFDEVYLNVFYQVHLSPNDTYYPNQWALIRTVADAAWGISTGSTGIVIAVLDVGGEYNHEDLTDNTWSGIGYDFYNGDSDPAPGSGDDHGTAVAGIAGAVTNNSIGVAGFAGGWSGSNGIRLMHMKVGAGISINVNAAAQATDSAAAWGARVLNMSFGGRTEQPALESAINRAVNDYNAVVVVSSGNYLSAGDEAVRYPARYPNSIAVGATVESDDRKSLGDVTDEPWWGSCYGPELDVVAPGIHIYTTDRTGSVGYSSGNYYPTFNGTSAAAPHVSGLVGLMLSINPSLTRNAVYNILTGSADKVSGMGGQNFHNEYGYGRINAYRALKNILETYGGTITQTLAIPAGDVWTFSPGVKLRVEGSLQVNGSSGSPVTFQGSGYAGSWFGIEFYNAPSGQFLNYCTVKDATYGVNLINTSGVNTNFSTLKGNSYGMNCSNNSSPTVISTAFDSDTYGVYGDATSLVNLGSGGPGYNSFRFNGVYDVYSTYPGTIPATGNWWGGCPPFPSVTGNVDYSNWLCTDPNPSQAYPDGTPLASRAESRRSFVSVKDQESAAIEAQGMNDINTAYRLYLDGNYKEALEAFEDIVANHPEDFAGRCALVFVERILARLGRSDEILATLNSVSTSSANTSLGTFAEARRTYEYLRQGRYEDAVAQASQVVEQNNDTTLVKFALYDLGSIYWYRLDDHEKAEQHYRRLIARYPDDPLSHSALATLGEFTGSQQKQPQVAQTEPRPGKLSLQNYPNPFNPTTTISYSVITPGKVSLKVYDLLGRVVATLVDGHQKEGVHQVGFDASGLASGIYFYQLTASGATIQRKMVVTK